MVTTMSKGDPMKESVSIVVLDREDPTTLESVKECLAEVDCEIVSCASEEALIDRIASSPVDVLVINLEKPFERSFRLLSDIQTKARQTEIIFVALFDDETLWAWMEVIQRGAYEFLPKPFKPEELRYYVRQAIKKHLSMSRHPIPSGGFAKNLNSALLHKTAQCGT
jgi:DNA-binding NtrC family response regulator